MLMICYYCLAQSFYCKKNVKLNGNIFAHRLDIPIDAK